MPSLVLHLTKGMMRLISTLLCPNFAMNSNGKLRRANFLKSRLLILIYLSRKAKRSRSSWYVYHFLSYLVLWASCFILKNAKKKASDDESHETTSKTNTTLKVGGLLPPPDLRGPTQSKSIQANSKSTGDVFDMSPFGSTDPFATIPTVFSSNVTSNHSTS